MNKIGLITLAICFLGLSSKAQVTKKDTSFSINGSFTGFADGTEVRLENANDNSLIASTKIIKGSFVIKGKLAEPELFWLKITGEAPQYIYLENHKITITATKPVANNFIVTGSSSNIDFSVFQSLFNPLIVQLQSIVPVINSSPFGQKRDSMMKVYDNILGQIQNNIDLFIKNHPASYVSPFILFVTNQFYDDPVLLESRFNRIDSVIKSSQIGVSLSQYIAYNKVGAVGTYAIDFSQPDTSGKIVSLNSFKGKYVLVDFWASWCGPCRRENPYVVANYNKFKDKNFTVLGVSLDKNGQKDKWLQAIHQDSLTWTHVSDLKYFSNAAAMIYHVDGIPFNILVDPDGKIIARKLRGDDLEKKLCELLGCN